MAFQTPLFFNISTGNLVLSATQPTVVGFPSWFFGDTKHLLIQFVQNADNGKVSIVPATGIGLQIAIGDPGGTPVTSATAPPAVNDVYTVDLPMNTSQIQTDVSGKGSKAYKFEFKTTDGGYSQRYEFPITILDRIISDTLVDTAPPDVAIGTNAANATFWKKDNAAGDFFVMRSPAGIKVKVYVDDSGRLQGDPLQ